MNTNKTYECLMDITGQESGVILFNNGDLIICNWSTEKGIPRLAPWGSFVIGLCEPLIVENNKRIEDIGQWLKTQEHQLIYDRNNDYLGLDGTPGTMYIVNEQIVIAPDNWA